MLRVLLKAVTMTQVQLVVNHQLQMCNKEMIVILVIKQQARMSLKQLSLIQTKVLWILTQHCHLGRLGGMLNDWRVYIICYTLEFGGYVRPKQAANAMYSELEVKRNALYNKLRQANSLADRAIIRSEMTNIGRDNSNLNAEFELIPNLVVPPPTAVYAHGRSCIRGHVITGGHCHGGNNSVYTRGKSSHACT